MRSSSIQLKEEKEQRTLYRMGGDEKRQKHVLRINREEVKNQRDRGGGGVGEREHNQSK